MSQGWPEGQHYARHHYCRSADLQVGYALRTVV